MHVELINHTKYAEVGMKKFVSEFKTFIARGNVMDMAVGVIIGGAFTAIVTSLVDNLFMPLISLLTGGLDFSAWALTLGSGENAAVLNYGLFISAVINFLLIALVVFLLVKGINKLRTDKEEPAATEKQCPYCKSNIDIEATRCPNCTSQLEA